MRNARRFKKEDQIIQFLMRLNDQYQSVKSQILLFEPLPPINKVLPIVLQEEKQQGYGASGRADVKENETDVLAKSYESNGANG